MQSSLLFNNHDGTGSAADLSIPPANEAAVVAAIQACSHWDAQIREPAEATIKGWELTKEPGYFTSLLSILHQSLSNSQILSPDLRILAAILTKNAVPKVWRWSIQDDDDDDDDNNNDENLIPESNSSRPAPSTSSSDYSNPQDLSSVQVLQQEKQKRIEERHVARQRLPHLLFSEPDERVAVHLRLALANIALFDFPRQWPTLATDLVQMAETGPPLGTVAAHPLSVRIRACKTVRDVLQTACHRKIIIKTPGGMRSLVSMHELQKKAMMERRRTHERVVTVFPNLAQQALKHAEITLSAGTGWTQEGTLTVAYLKSIREIMPMIISIDSVKGDLQLFLQSAVQLLKEIQGYPLSFPPNAPAAYEGGGLEGWNRMIDKVFRATLSCCMVAMDVMPVAFAPLVSPTLELVLQGMLGLEMSTIHTVPSKRLVLQARYVNHVLSVRQYNSELDNKIQQRQQELAKALGGAIRFVMPPSNVNSVSDQDTPGVMQAQQAVAGLLSEGLCERVLEALVTKFLRWTPLEVEEWDADPEGHFQNEDAERTAMDADTPRHCARIVLVSMMQKGTDRVGEALLALARHCNQQQDLETLLTREACYSAIQCCSQWMPQKGLEFSDWWDAELKGLLTTSLGPESPIAMRALQSRAIQVLIAYDEFLEDEDFAIAFPAITNLLTAPDIVTALNAARALSHFATMPLRQRKKDDEDPMLQTVKTHSVTALGNAFALAHRVSSDECLRAVLLLVSGIVEVNGKSLEHCLPAIAEQLPPLWERSGDSVPVHSCLLAVLSHLIMKLGYPAMENPHIQKVLFPLVDYCTDISQPHRVDTLLEEGLKLWLVIMLTSRMTAMRDMLTSMMPRLFAILRLKHEPYISLQILQFYAILFGPEVLQPHVQTIVNILDSCTSPILPAKNNTNSNNDDDMMTDSASSSNNNNGNNQQQSDTGSLRDCITALSFMEDLLQFYPSIAIPICAPLMGRLLRALVSTNSQHPVPLVHAMLGVLSRLLWHQPAILEEIFVNEDPNGSDGAKQVKLLVQVWLQVISGSTLADFLSASLSVERFLARKAAALSLCSAICRSPKLAGWIGSNVVAFTTSLEKTEERMELDLDTMVDVACGSARETVGDGPLGDVTSRMRENLTADPLLTIPVKDALDKAQEAVKNMASSSSSPLDDEDEME